MPEHPPGQRPLPRRWFDGTRTRITVAWVATMAPLAALLLFLNRPLLLPLPWGLLAPVAAFVASIFGPRWSRWAKPPTGAPASWVRGHRWLHGTALGIRTGLVVALLFLVAGLLINRALGM